MSVSCNQCGKCIRGCKSDPNCAIVASICPNKPILTRLSTGTAQYIPGSLNESTMELYDSSAPDDRSRRMKFELCTHRNLSLDSATITDLATAFGRKSFFLPNALETINGLRASIHIRKKLKKEKILKGTGDHEEDNIIADSYIIKDSP